MLIAYLGGVGLCGPGLPSWRASLAVLRGETCYQYGPLPALRANQLPANERRRVTLTIRLALQVAQEAVDDAGLSADSACSVFATSGGDNDLIHSIFTALCRPDRPVSPTQFHNSVHNAPAGYWGIASGSRMPSTSLSAYDWTFSAGLLEAAAIATVEQAPVILAAYDGAPPFPLSEVRAVDVPFAAAALLTPTRMPGTRAQLKLTLIAGVREDRMSDPTLERLRNSNPAARCLPLFKAIAGRDREDVILPYQSEDGLVVEVTPCE